MNVSFNKICKYFSEKSIKLYEDYKTDILFNDVKFITKKQTIFLNNVIYIGKVSMLYEQLKNIEEASFILVNDENTPITDTITSKINIIELQSQEDIFDIFNQIKDLFNEDVSASNDASALLKSIITGKGLDYIVKVATEILGNPVVVIDTSYKVLSHPDIEQITDIYWLENIKRGYCSFDFIAAVKKMKSIQNGFKANEPFEVVCEANSTVKMVTKIEIENKHIGSIVLLACNKAFSTKDVELLSLTSKIIAEEMKKNSLYRNINNVEYEEVVCDFLEGNIKNREILNERIKSAKIKFKDNILIFVFDIKKYSSMGKYVGYLTDRLNSFFPFKRAVYYDDNIVIIYDYEKDIKNDDFLYKLKSFLEDNRIFLGVSNEFSDLMNCRHHYEQALKALRIGERIDKENPIVYYSDVQFYDLISNTQKFVDYKEFYHPALIKLKQYDKENNTELFNTLIVYLKNNQSLQKTSKELFIHRNTMTYRMQKILSIVNLDLTNNENIFNIYMSYKIMNYIDSNLEN